VVLQHYYAGTLIANAIQLVTETGFSAKATIGEADTIHVIVDDPGGTLDFVAYKPWKMVETAAPVGRQVAWYGFVTDQEIGDRAGDTVFTTGVGRAWELTLDECNGFIGRRVLWATTPRPAETVSARLAWLMNQAGFTGIIFDHGLIETDTTQLDPRDYNGLYGAEVLRDCSLVSGLNFFVRYREASDDLELAFYNSRTSALDTSTLRISNDPADIDYVTTWPPHMETKLRRGATRIAGGIYLPFNGGAFFGNNPAVETAFGFVDRVAPAAAVTTYATAAPLVNRLLLEHSEQDERIVPLKVRLPAANLNDVYQGQRIEFRHTRRPGWQSFRSARLAMKSFSRPPNRTQDFYDVDMELTPAATPGLAAKLYSTTTQEIPTTTATLVTFNTAAIEIGGTWYSGGSPTRATVPTGAGTRTVLVIATAWWDEPDLSVFNNTVVRVKKNGVQIRGTQNYAFNALKGRQAIGLVRVSAGDYLEAEVYQDTGATMTLGAALPEHYSTLMVVGLDEGAAAKAYTTATQSIANNTDVALNLATAEFEIGGTFFAGGSPSRLTVPAGSPTALWLIGGEEYVSAAPAGRNGIRLRINGSTYVRGSWADMAETGAVAATPTIGVASLSAGDYVELIAYQNSGAPITAGNAAEAVNTALWMVRIDGLASKVFYDGAGFAVAQDFWAPIGWTAEESDAAGVWSPASPTKFNVAVKGTWLVAVSSFIQTTQFCSSSLRLNGPPDSQALVAGAFEMGFRNPIAVSLVAVTASDFLEGMVAHPSLTSEDFGTGGDLSDTPVMWALVF
jgi:hypothetical protein